MVENCFSISVFCVCAVIFAVMLRRYCQEQSLLAALAACVAVIGVFISMIAPVMKQTIGFFTESGISSEYIEIVLKAAAICFITQITCDICRDSGENAIASAAELWGRGAVTVMSLPVIEALLEMIRDFL